MTSVKMYKTLKNLYSFIFEINTSRFLKTSSTSFFLNVRDPAVEKKSGEVIVAHENYFDKYKEKTKKVFYDALQLYITKNNVHRRGHVEFLYAALSRVDNFMAQRDINTYRKLLEVFPKYKMIPKNVWQEEFMHYPKQQQCCIDILDYMEKNGVIPDDDFGYQLRDIFGHNSHVFRKYRRMMYWMPKFKYANPYFVPYNLPDDQASLAELLLRRMSPDPSTTISHFQTDKLEGCVDRTFVVSAQSASQRHLLSRLSKQQEGALVVEGGMRTWARHASMLYFVLKAAISPSAEECQECEWKADRQHERARLHTFNEEGGLQVARSVHEQDDGVVLAMAITGTSSKDSLVSWIKLLEDTNPSLSLSPILFQLTHHPSPSSLTPSTHAPSLS